MYYINQQRRRHTFTKKSIWSTWSARDLRFLIQNVTNIRELQSEELNCSLFVAESWELRGHREVMITNHRQWLDIALLSWA